MNTANKKRTSAAKKAVRPSAAKKRAARPAAAKTKAPAKKAAGKRAVKSVARRADFGAPIDAFFAKQPPALRAITEALRALIEQAAPQASASLKWGMPVYELDGKIVCAIGAHKAHVNLILAGSEDTFDDPDGLLTGAGKTGRHLKLTELAQLPRAQVKAWLKQALQAVRAS